MRTRGGEKKQNICNSSSRQREWIVEHQKRSMPYSRKDQSMSPKIIAILWSHIQFLILDVVNQTKWNIKKYFKVSLNHITFILAKQCTVCAETTSSYLRTGRCRLSLSLHISDQAEMDATVWEQRVKEKRLREKKKKKKTKCQHAPSKRWARIIHHCLPAKLWHSLCYWSGQHHRINVVRAFRISTHPQKAEEAGWNM